MVTTQSTGRLLRTFGRLGSAPVEFEVVHIARNTPALFGTGQLDAIEDDTLRALADTSYPKHPEVTGRLATRGLRMGRFGWKGQTSSLGQFVADACRVEVGLRARQWRD